jgi:predicted Zn-dependent protease
MIGFGGLLNYAFVFSVVCLLASILNYFVNKKGIVFSDLKLSKIIKTFLFILISLFVFTLFNYTLRYMAASKYMAASNAFSSGKLEEAKSEISKAITIAPYDTYYLGRIDIITEEINKLVQSKATNTEELQSNYKTLVEYQINDAKKAIAYDDKNPQNYMALGYAYERAMVLTKDGAYELAISAYENARKLATDKDYVDTVKAKTAFSAEKEQEGLTFIDSALRFNSSSSPALYLSSQYYAAKNKIDTALEYAEKTVLTAPYATDGRTNLGLLYLKTEKYDAAIAEFGNVLYLTNGKDAGAMYYLALSYKAKGDMENLNKVIVELEKIIDPNSKEMQALKN